MKFTLLAILIFLVTTTSLFAQKRLIVYSDELCDSENITTYVNSIIVFDLINKTYQRTTGSDKFPKYKVYNIKQELYNGSLYILYELSGKGKIESVLINDYSIFELYGYKQWQNFKITSISKE